MMPIYINGSCRKGGHTTAIAKLLSGSGNQNVIHLLDYEMGYFEYDNSNSKDDFMPLIKELAESDVWIFLTPVYWYSMSARMKTFFDRLSDLIKWEKDIWEKIKCSKWYALSCGSDDAEVPGFFEPFKRSAEYLDIQYMGDVHVWKDKRQPIEEEVISRLKAFQEAISKGETI
ncbi:MAG: NAD(P)H-dependent oxidoreductase [Saprospiraceae bacterium]|nr:NAD(P)H-dependent oxidoreductase [Saprospiraceae bacterium]